MSELLQQLRYAPEKIRMRQMDEAERLIAEIDPSRNYPEDFIVFRITGYRPETGASTMLVGEALLPDLVNFVLRISRDLHLPHDYNGRVARRLQDIAPLLHISTKSLQRYRSQGLVCHYVQFDDGQPLLACFDDSLRRFMNANESRVSSAAQFTRIDGSDRKRIIDHARQLHVREELSLNETARRLAIEHNRAHETVRIMLREYDRRSDRPIFTARGPVSDRDAQLMYRAWRLGVSINDMATRFAKTTSTIHRSINRCRAARVQALDLTAVQLPTFHMEEADEVILSHPAVTHELDEHLPNDDALQLIAAIRDQKPLDENSEHAMIAAYNFLKHTAASTIAAFPHWPGSNELDLVETSLRWAERLKRRLLSFALPAALRSIEQHLHRALHEQPAEHIVSHLHTAVEVAGRVIDTINPSRGQRLERMTAHAVDRALAAAQAPLSTSRAAMRHRDGTVQLEQLLEHVTPWSWLDATRYSEHDLERLTADQRRLIKLRHGLHGKPPRTCKAIADLLGRTPSSVARKIAAAQRQLRRGRGANQRFEN